MNNLDLFKKKRILILAGSSDIGIQLVKNLLIDKWFIVAHCSSNNKSFDKLKNKNLKIIKLNFKNFKQIL